MRGENLKLAAGPIAVARTLADLSAAVDIRPNDILEAF
jgi:hypothetical protein